MVRRSAGFRLAFATRRRASSGPAAAPIFRTRAIGSLDTGEPLPAGLRPEAQKVAAGRARGRVRGDPLADPVGPRAGDPLRDAGLGDLGEHRVAADDVVRLAVEHAHERHALPALKLQGRHQHALGIQIGDPAAHQDAGRLHLGQGRRRGQEHVMPLQREGRPARLIQGRQGIGLALPARRRPSDESEVDLPAPGLICQPHHQVIVRAREEFRHALHHGIEGREFRHEVGGQVRERGDGSPGGERHPKVRDGRHLVDLASHDAVAIESGRVVHDEGAPHLRPSGEGDHAANS